MFEKQFDLRYFEMEQHVGADQGMLLLGWILYHSL